MKVAVVGGGPGGSRSAELLSDRGARVILYECRRGWEKPCGGGVPERSVDFCPFLANPDLPQRSALRARLYSPRNREATVLLAEPLRVFRRRDLNGFLLERAEASGVQVRPARVTSVQREGRFWRVTDTSGHTERVDFLVGADGASGVVRGRVAKHLPPLLQCVGLGYFVEGYTSDEIVVKFFDALDGYLWVFPRLDHLAVGICGPTGPGRSEQLLPELERFLVDFYGANILRQLKRYGARIPSLPRSLAGKDACLGDGWALVGDAAGLVDPLTREGIHYALASAQFLAEALSDGNPEGYPRRWEASFRGELEWAGRHKDLFFSRHFIEAFTVLSSASRAVQAIVSDLVAGRQQYKNLRKGLTANAPSAAVALAARFIKRGLGGAAPMTPPTVVSL